MPSHTIPIDAIPESVEPIFEPIFGKVVVKIDTNPERRYGKLYLPQKDTRRATIGTIFAVYAPTETSEGMIEPEVKVGDTVLFGQFTGTAFNVGRHLFVICKEHDLLTVVRFPDGAEEPQIEEVLE